MRTTESKTTSRLIVAGAVVAAVLALALALWGCAPNATGATTDQKGDDKATEETTTSASVYPNFTEKAAGLFPDTYFNRDMLNTGNRGCNACHENLFDKMVNKEGLTHILSYVGYEKDGTYKDCEPCHQGHMTLTGPYLGDAIHASHYGNQQFVDANGNCWSCHAVNSDGEASEYQFMLWEDFYEQAALGGYPWLADDETTRAWVESRGYAGGYPTEFSQEKSPNISATFAQDATDAKDLFIVNNWGPDAIDLEAVSADSNPLSITGVNNPRTFTVEEIRAMPQTEFTAFQNCATNGEGGALMENIPMKGVPLSYLVEQCGGLVEGTNAMNASGNDGWAAFPPMDMALDLMYEDCYVVTQYYGQNLTVDQGAPLVLVPCGMPGAQWVKHLGTIDFKVADQFMDGPTYAAATAPSPKINVNGMWFQNNGLSAKVGEKVALTGACTSWSKIVGELDTIRFSFDLGQTWQEYKVTSEVPNFDPYQWVNYTLEWTPSAPGKYQVKLDAIDTEGNHIPNPVTLFVNVEE